MKADHNDVIGKRATGKARSGATRYERKSFVREQPDDGNRLFACSWENREARLASVAGKSIRVVNQ